MSSDGMRYREQSMSPPTSSPRGAAWLRRIVLLTAIVFCLPASALAAPRSAYVADYATPGSVSEFTIGSGGVLANHGAVPANGDNTWFSAMTPDGKHLYVTNENSASVAQYDVNADGTLTALSPATVTTGGGPIGIAVSPDGKSVYVANEAGSISLFNVASNGALTPKSPSTVATSNLSEPFGLAVSPNGRSLYVTNFNGTVAQFSVGSGGSLSPKSTPTVPAGSEDDFIALTPMARTPM
jgi:6-phosphogluconolactonase (cycloisomerase 2 family)